MSSYFSLEDIFATQERIVCQVNKSTNAGEVDEEGLAGLGFLDGGSESTASRAQGNNMPSALPPGTKLELPIWMVKALVTKAKLGAKMEIRVPPIYSFAKRAGQMKADPLALSLPRVGPLHFYTTGIHILPYSLVEDAREETEVGEGEDLGAILAEVLTKRFRYILDASCNSDSSEAPSMTDKLDFLERRLYQQGQKSQQQLQRWFRRQTDEIHAADMVRRHRKRKADTIN